jgi:PleD family two-component response regulator
MTGNPAAHEAPYILIVDDDWMNREVIEAYLKTVGYCVGAASNGPQALEMAFASPPDLVMLDARMPGMDGFEVCERLKRDERTRFTPVLMVTGLDADEELQRAIDAGVDDFIGKPFNSLVMLARVKSLVRIKRLYDQLGTRNRT